MGNKNREKRPIGLVYILTYIFISVIFLKMIYPDLLKSFFEQDLLWFIPAVFRFTKGLSFWQLIGYFLNPLPAWYAVPYLKAYTYFNLLLFGPLPKYFIIVSIIFHFVCSFLVFLLGKNLGMGFRVSFLSSLMYLVLFAHFHAYMWPMAFFHLIVVFFILLGLVFYLKTDNLIVNNFNFRRPYILSLLINFFASFTRFNILILPAMIISHILFCSKDGEERVRKYKIWMPLFIIYMLYPLFFISSGDLRFHGLVSPLTAKLSFIFRNALFCSIFAKINTATKFLILLLTGFSFLYAFKIALVIHSNLRYRVGRVLRQVFIIMAALVFVILLINGGLKRLLIPYNIFVPFMSLMSSFLYPLEKALLMDSTRPYYYIPLLFNIFDFLLGAFILFLFIKIFILKQKQLIILVAFYLFNLIYLYLWNPIPSRYFIYLSPVSCLIFCAVFDFIFFYYMDRARLKIQSKEIILCLIFIVLCIPNLLAIKLSLSRGKMVNNFLAYDYIRAASLIKEDLNKAGSLKQTKTININSFIPMAFAQEKDLSAPDPFNDNMRFIIMQVLSNVSVDVKINQITQKNKEQIAYYLEGERIKNNEGMEIDSFTHFFEKAQEDFRDSNYSKAERVLEKAIKKRPFLFNFLLQEYPVESLPWVTGGYDLRTWLSKIDCFYSFGFDGRGLAKNKYITNIANKEIDDYIQCLFYMAYLKFINQDGEGAKLWFSKIRFLESDYSKLRSWLTETTLVKSDKRMLAFLDGFDNSSLYAVPDNYRDRFKFEKFILGLI